MGAFVGQPEGKFSLNSPNPLQVPFPLFLLKEPGQMF